jgi:hypothetical protein
MQTAITGHAVAFIETPMPAANQPPPELGGNVVAFSSPRLTNGE